MAIIFEMTKNLTGDTEHNIDPLLVRTPFLIDEPKTSMYQYFLQLDKPNAYDKHADTTLKPYNTLAWDNLQRHLTIRAVSRIGAKNFPQIGAIGFYKDLYTGQSSILAPVHVDYPPYKAPSIAIIVDTNVNLTITPPTDINYTCYKIVVRNNYLANEYVVYELETALPLPEVIGDYEIYVIGYNETTGACSAWSNVVTFNIATGKATWEPEPLVVPMRFADLQDVSLADLLNAQSLYYNSITQKWENSAPPAPAANLTGTLLAADWVGTDAPFSQTITVTDLIASGYAYVVSPESSDWGNYYNYGIYMGEPTVDGQVTFYASLSKPASDIDINLLKVGVT